MLTWWAVGVQWDRVIVLREQARSHRDMHSTVGAGLLAKTPVHSPQIQPPITRPYPP